jgi:hypothetical protein
MDEMSCPKIAVAYIFLTELRGPMSCTTQFDTDCTTKERVNTDTDTDISFRLFNSKRIFLDT